MGLRWFSSPWGIICTRRQQRTVSLLIFIGPLSSFCYHWSWYPSRLPFGIGRQCSMIFLVLLKVWILESGAEKLLLPAPLSLECSYVPSCLPMLFNICVKLYRDLGWPATNMQRTFSSILHYQQIPGRLWTLWNRCLKAILDRITSDKLKLNHDRAEVLLVGWRSLLSPVWIGLHST